jgi:DNA (cytosine-5)-methyltransferase 1
LTAVDRAAFGGGNTSDEPRGGYAALTAKGQRIDFEVETFIVSGHGDYRPSEIPTLRASGGDVQGGSEGLVAHSLRGEGFDASEDGTGRGTPIVPVFAIQERAVSENPENGPQGKGYQEDVAFTLEARNKTQGVVHSVSAPEVADTVTVGANQTTGFTGDDIACRDAYSLDMRNAGRDPEKKDEVNRQGVGVGDNCAHTISASHVNAVAFSMRGREGGAVPEVESEDIAPALRTDGGGSSKTFVAFAQNTRDEVRIQGDGNVAGALAAEPGMKQQTYIAFSSKDYGADASEEVSPTLRSGAHSESHANAGVPPAVAFDWYASESQSFPVNEGFSPPLKTTMQPAVQNGWAVRRLTPRECERLQGFPDDYTQIPNWDGWREVGADENIDDLVAAGLTVKPSKNGFRVNDPDGVRYKALGNSMAVNVMRWIGWRIDHFEKLVAEGKIPR